MVANYIFMLFIELTLRMRDTASMLGDTEVLLVIASLIIMARSSQLWTEIMMTIIDTTVLKTLKGLGGSKSMFYS